LGKNKVKTLGGRKIRQGQRSQLWKLTHNDLHLLDDCSGNLCNCLPSVICEKN
jgi:hypothetical protein